MATFAWVQAPNKIPQLLNKIHDVGLPSGKVTQTWLKQAGFGSSNDRTLLGALRQIRFLDQSGNITEHWKDFRRATGEDRKAALGRAIKEGYADLFAMYANAHQRSDAELEAFFRGHVTAGASVLQKTIQTFKMLASIASFDGSSTAEYEGQANFDPAAVPSHLPTARVSGGNAGAPMTIAINVQLAVPETKDAEVYEAFFQSMRKHLLS